MKKPIIPFWLFVALWFAAVLLPFCFLRVIPVAAVLVGIGLPILWVWQMPATCMSRGLIAAFMGMGQLTLLLFWVVVGVIRFLKL